MHNCHKSVTKKKKPPVGGNPAKIIKMLDPKEQKETW